jgi:hypothetical protein
MAEPGKRRTPLQKAWENLIVRTAAYYALLLGGIAGLWRWFPDSMTLLTRDLSGDISSAGEPAGPGAFEDILLRDVGVRAGLPPPPLLRHLADTEA